MTKFIIATRRLASTKVPVMINTENIAWINRYQSDDFTRIVFNGADKDGALSINVEETLDELSTLIRAVK